MLCALWLPLLYPRVCAFGVVDLVLDDEADGVVEDDRFACAVDARFDCCAVEARLDCVPELLFACAVSRACWRCWSDISGRFSWRFS